MGIVNRKKINLSLSLNTAAKLDKMASKAGKPKARILDSAVETLYQQEEDTMDHKGITITIATNKGGTGKTTSIAAMADVLARRGNRVLVIDTDPQGNLSSRFGYDPTDLQKNYIGNLIYDRMGIKKDDDGNEIHKDIREYINSTQMSPRVDIVISDIRLDDAFKLMCNDSLYGTTIMRKIISEIRKLDMYDYILIDTRPSLGNEVAAIFIAANYVLIPIVPSKDAMYGANSAMQLMIKCRDANRNLKLLGIFTTMVYDRNKSYREVAPVLKENWEKYLFNTSIPRSQDAVNAENRSEPVTFAFSNKKLAKKYELLTDEIVERLKKEATLDGNI